MRLFPRTTVSVDLVLKVERTVRHNFPKKRLYFMPNYIHLTEMRDRIVVLERFKNVLVDKGC